MRTTTKNQKFLNLKALNQDIKKADNFNTDVFQKIFYSRK